MMSSISPIWIVIMQAVLVVHVLATGRSRYWILVLLFLPLIGAVAYLALELVPDWASGIRGQRARRNMGKLVNPGGQLRRLEAAWRQSPNTDNARHYAAALIESGRHEQAESVLQQALSGLFATEPNLLLLKARLRFDQGDPQGAVDALDLLQEQNPEFRSAEGHLLLARSLEQAGHVQRALAAYRDVATYFPGVEARYRLALALAAAGDNEASREELEQILSDAQMAPAHFRRAQAAWLRKCRAALK